MMIDAVEAAQAVVLLVEDEPSQRMCAADIPEDEGFEVIEATTAPAALKILEKRDDVTALFTDIDIPGGMNGLELAGIVHARWPHIALVVTSGRYRVGADHLPGDGVFISKPYAAAAPVRIIRERIRQRSEWPGHH